MVGRLQGDRVDAPQGRLFLHPTPPIKPRKETPTPCTSTSNPAANRQLLHDQYTAGKQARNGPAAWSVYTITLLPMHQQTMVRLQLVRFSRWQHDIWLLIFMVHPDKQADRDRQAEQIVSLRLGSRRFGISFKFIY